MGLKRAWGTLSSLLRAGGVRKTAAYAVHRLREALQEKRLGISTSSGGAGWDAQKKENPNCHINTPTPYLTLKRVFRHIGVREGEDVLLDYGSGSGRVVIVAATYPFRKVIGLELVGELYETSLENVRRAKEKGRLRCRDIEMIHGDATAYSLPAEVTVLFFGSPFSGPVLDKVLDNIEASLKAAPRKVTIVFYNPPHFEEKARLRGWLKKREELSGIVPTANLKVVVYDAMSTASPAPI